MSAATTPDARVVYKVDRDRDGRSFSARRVVAVQDGEVLFNLTASFHVEREGAVASTAARSTRPTAPTE